MAGLLYFSSHTVSARTDRTGSSNTAGEATLLAQKLRLSMKGWIVALTTEFCCARVAEGALAAQGAQIDNAEERHP